MWRASSAVKWGGTVDVEIGRISLPSVAQEPDGPCNDEAVGGVRHAEQRSQNRELDTRIDPSGHQYHRPERSGDWDSGPPTPRKQASNEPIAIKGGITAIKILLAPPR